MADSGLAQSIDSLLSQRGSPMAGLGGVFVAAGKKYGIDPRLVVSISGIESGFGKHIPSGTFNAWGWGPGRPLGSWEEGINTVTRGLSSGYSGMSLLEIANKYAPASDGNDPQHWADTVGGFIHQLGGSYQKSRSVGGQPSVDEQATAASSSGATSRRALLPPPDPFANVRSAALGTLSDIAVRGHASPVAMMQQLGMGYAADRAAAEQYQSYLQALGPLTAPTPPPTSSSPTPSSPPSPGPAVPASDFSATWFKPGLKVIGTPYSGTHTLGNWQSDNAIDISVPTGTPIYAPVAGTLGNTGSLGRGGRFAGLRTNLYGGGNGFYFAHMSRLGPGIRAGATVKKGQLLGYTGSANGVDHLHFAVEKGSPVSYYSY